MFTYEGLKKRIENDKIMREKQPAKEQITEVRVDFLENMFKTLEEDKRQIPINKRHIIAAIDDIGLTIWNLAVNGEYESAYYYLERFREETRIIESIYAIGNRQN